MNLLNYEIKNNNLDTLELKINDNKENNIILEIKELNKNSIIEKYTLSEVGIERIKNVLENHKKILDLDYKDIEIYPVLDGDNINLTIYNKTYSLNNIIYLWEEYDENYPNLNKFIMLIDDIYEILDDEKIDPYNVMPLSISIYDEEE